MAAAAELDGFDGIGRCRKKKEALTNLPSHYQFAYWRLDAGRRIAVPVGGVRKDKRDQFPLISTVIKNEGTGTETLVWLHFDLDFKRALKKWIRNNRLDWPTIGDFLRQEMPEFFHYLSYVVLSSGGQGLSLVLAISPLELIPETSDVQRLAYDVQAKIIRILNSHGLGADEGARGLKRLMPNVFREDKVLDQAEFVQQVIQTKRPRVLQKLLYSLRFHPALRAQNKSEREDILWNDIRIEVPCAQLYMDLLDSAGPWGSTQFTALELSKRYGISKNTVYKILSSPPKWLGVERIHGEGYRLTIRPTTLLTKRVYELAEIGKSKDRSQTLPSFFVSAIPNPSKVMHGARNSWLVSVVLACKWKGICRGELITALGRVIKQVPGWQKSRSLTRDLGAIVRSIYQNRASLAGRSPDLELPSWLSEALTPTTPKQVSQIFYKKGAFGSQGGATPPPKYGHGNSNIRTLSSAAKGGARPVGFGGGPGPRIDQLSDFPPPVDNDRSEGSPAVPRAIGKTSAAGPDLGLADAQLNLRGSDLSRAFSKALMRSPLIASEKARILGEVTAIDDPELKEQRKRDWLSKLQ